jgi:hypothetical protein
VPSTIVDRSQVVRTRLSLNLTFLRFYGGKPVWPKSFLHFVWLDGLDEFTTMPADLVDGAFWGGVPPRLILAPALDFGEGLLDRVEVSE